MIMEITWLFPKTEGLFVGVLIIRALVFGVCTRAPDFGKLPYGGFHE